MRRRTVYSAISKALFGIFLTVWAIAAHAPFWVIALAIFVIVAAVASYLFEKKDQTGSL
ncbi:hypothetical protein [Kocuria sp.]|uniref:hypothetical protein n=1 Tax=Kocuria sp. TaxID=1871328 RepID=UPI0026DC9834|nr:hypothetical protein [Kocuria sp.]MDO4918439.1 hypothetical protein [Kocuria sp.]